MIKDYFKVAIKNIFNRKLRSWLTMIGIFIGIAAVVALISLGSGMQKAITSQFGKIGANRISISPGGAIAGPLSENLGSGILYSSDVEAVRNVKGVEFATGPIAAYVELEFNKEIEYVALMAFDDDTKTLRYMEEMGLAEVEYGRQIKTGATREVILGNRIANDLFDKPIQVGNSIYVDNYKFNVVGIQKKSDSSMFDTVIRISKKTAEDLFERENPSNIFAKVDDNYEPTEVLGKLEKALRKEHNVDEGEEDFTIEIAADVIESFTRILTTVQILVISIAAISIVVGAVGITNTMYTAVLERTGEIGIMKAIGARNSDILTIFLIESGMLGLVGGLIGIFIGVGIGKAVEVIAKAAMNSNILQAHFPWYLILGSLLFSFLLGAIAGTMPAKQASKMNPIDALRYE